MNDTIQEQRGSLTVLMGIPASGKSSFATRHHYVVCPDTIREEMFGDASHQGDNDKVFAEAHWHVRQLLAQGAHVVFDATNVRADSRAQLLDLAKQHPSDTRLVVVGRKLSLEEIKRRNAGRERVVPEPVLDKMYKQFIESLSQIGNEPWDEIVFSS